MSIFSHYLPWKSRGPPGAPTSCTQLHTDPAFL